MEVDRRKHPRYRLNNGEFVAIGRNTDMLAFVQNAGAGGLQLQYVSEIGRADQWQRLTIIGGNCSQILIADVSCQVAYDIQSLMEEGSFRGLNVRLCGLAFNELTQLQENILYQLIARRSASKNGKKE